MAGSPAPHATELPPLPRLAANDGEIALQNLDAQIDSLEKHGGAPGDRIALAERLQTRAQLTGCVEDYERADELTAALVAARPSDPQAHRARSTALATFHEFEAAVRELDRAEAAGARPDALAAARGTIFEAQGRYDDAAAMLPKAALTPLQLATAGILAGERGDMAAATSLLARARAAYADVSPFPLAWMDVQEASLHERLGQRAHARRHYERAVALVPRFARAASHLAAMSTPEVAIALLEPIAARCDDPEVLGQLADAFRRAGRLPDAAKVQADADARYDILVARHPKAFADHAALALLTTGRDPARALALARVNAKERRTPEALDLLLSAALAADDSVAACDAARVAASLEHPTPDLTAVASPIAAKCAR
jgi:tetratricopeptide (TPR) repeat protein